jgi:hypothetical protein
VLPHLRVRIPDGALTYGGWKETIMRDLGVALLAGLVYGVVWELGVVRRLEFLLLDISMALVVRWATRVYGKDAWKQ